MAAQEVWRRWRLLQRMIQSVILVGFLALFVSGTLGAIPDRLTALFLRLDPLSGIATMLATRQALAAFMPSITLFALALITGRAWCGWLCPLGTLLHWTSRRGIQRALAPAWRWAKLGILVAVVAGAVLSVQTFILLSPLPLLAQGFVGLLRPLLDLWSQSSQPTSVPLVTTTSVMGPLGSIGRVLFPSLLLVLVLTLNAVAPRFWCRGLCPLGALLGLLARRAWLHREVGPQCTDCGLCARRCPAGAIQEGDWRSDSAECLLCLECTQACAPGALSWRPGRGTTKRSTVDSSRRRLLASLAAGLGAAGLMRLERGLGNVSPRPLRPPGVQGADMIACIRCGCCVGICPTGALRPAILGAGISEIGTPLLFPRQGYCRYSCNACGQACPSGAIPALSLETKQRQVIGIARVDPNRCLTWTENSRCTVCADTCPVPGSAVRLHPEEALNVIGQRVVIERPQVVQELCIGCGICEYNCPVEGVAAIRVHAPKVGSPADAASV